MSFREMVEYSCSTPLDKENFYDLLDKEIYRHIQKDMRDSVDIYETLVNLYTELQDKDDEEKIKLIDECFIAITGYRLSILIQNVYAEITVQKGDAKFGRKDH